MLGRSIDVCAMHFIPIRVAFHTLLISSLSPCMRTSIMSSMLPHAKHCCTHSMILVAYKGGFVSLDCLGLTWTDPFNPVFISPSTWIEWT
ncbi:hypothetical protein PR202_ga05721 [Eleusine coracana subsp. coracana]|uniref:Uncharacterized protein n=1 Tax=Eleusine coracana subsp. coracana TaxID=191504 RepID=A0AAV5BT35_ELECO|nr:hypothetical protein PR202_ga05721 [Eleusine coracana subsp. coracana]